MENKTNSDIQDFATASTELSTTSLTFNSEENTDYISIRDYWNVVNSRFIHYASKTFSNSLSFQPKENYKTACARELDSCMNTLLDRYIQQKMVNCASNSDLASAALSKSSLFNKTKRQSSRSTNNLKTDDSLADLLKLKLLHYEMNQREEQIFKESLDECDNWRELEKEFQGRSNQAMTIFAENQQDESKLHEAVKKDNIRTKKLEEINKTLLIGVEVDYVEDEESKKIMFKENV